MAELVLLAGRELGQGASPSWQQKDGVVAEAVRAGRLVGDAAVDVALGDHCGPVGVSQAERADEVSAAPLGGYAAQAVEEQLHALCIVQPRPAKAGRAQAGSTVQSVDDETRIVAQGNAGIMRGERYRF